MSISFQITQSIQNRSLKIGILYGKFEALSRHADIQKKTSEYLLLMSNVAAITIDKSLPQRFSLVPPGGRARELQKMVGSDIYQEYLQYSELKNLLHNYDIQQLSIQKIQNLHQKILPKSTNIFRKRGRLLSKFVTENGVLKEMSMEVKTTPGQIIPKLHDFLVWFHSNRNTGNPLIIAAISHLIIIGIHPFDDGNGRLARIIEQMALHANKIFSTHFIFTEPYFLQNFERYYDLIESTIQSQNYTEWIEFYTEAVLTSLLEAAKVVHTLSFGAIDLENNAFIDLNELEQKVIQLTRIKGKSITDIAKELGYSRQNIYRVLAEIQRKGLTL